ncbi:hypothetical protein RhiJN_03026 [Ceratobasidium sp. AG-Ba]|nr:hypothetical protein RhiJN_03026 [Ceratobasidium sp. AG-Ba]QRW03914.1 hypothetical protein RhiLY_02913 [Ceratobasidium sp. AG-Ba]
MQVHLLPPRHNLTVLSKASPNIPANLWEKAYLRAAQVMKLPDDVQPASAPPTPKGPGAGISVDTWISLNGFLSPGPDDEKICAFNLFTPGLCTPLAEPVDLAHHARFSSLLYSSEEFDGGSPVIVSLPNQSVPAAAETKPHTSQVGQTSELDDKGARNVHTLLFLPHPVLDHPVIQPTIFRPSRPWSGASNMNTASANVLSRASASWDKPNSRQSHTSNADHQSSSNGWNANGTPSSQNSVDHTPSSERPANSFTLFGDSGDGSNV